MLGKGYKQAHEDTANQLVKMIHNMSESAAAAASAELTITGAVGMPSRPEQEQLMP